MYSTKLLILAILLSVWNCSCNVDPCADPSNTGLIPFREVAMNRSQISTYPTLNDTTNCYSLTFSFDAYYDYYRSYTWAGVFGNFQDLCNNGTQLRLFATSDSGVSLQFSSKTLKSAEISAVDMTGSVGDGFHEYGVNVTIGASYFSSNRTKPSLIRQRDDFFSNEYTPCTIRVRDDWIERRTLYSDSFPITIRLYTGELVHFIFPAGTRAYANNEVKKTYYQQCTCSESI